MVERADAFDEDLLERRVRDLEPEGLAAGRDRRAEDGLRIAPAVDLERSQAMSPSVEVATRTTWWPVERLTSRVGPAVTIRPWSMIATESHSSSACSSWWVLNTTVLPRSRISVKAALSNATLTGSSPEKGSSIRITSGSWRIVAMYWTFCWLPFESDSALRSAYSAIRKRASQWSASVRAFERGTPYSEAK